MKNMRNRRCVQYKAGSKKGGKQSRDRDARGEKGNIQPTGRSRRVR